MQSTVLMLSSRLLLLLLPVVIHISEGHCDDSRVTVCDESNYSCESFDQVSSLIQYLRETTCYHVKVVFSPHYNLSKVVVFENLSRSLISLTLSGNNSEAVITCDQLNAGLAFKGITNVSLLNLTVEKCGVFMNNTTKKYSLITGVHFEKCENIILEFVTIRNCYGNGVTMINNRGAISVMECTFEGNEVHENYRNQYLGGNGFDLIMLSVQNSSINFQMCQFLDNYATTGSESAVEQSVLGGAQGGGLYVAVLNVTSGNKISIKNCHFSGNQAIWGGGMHILFKIKEIGSITGNTIEVTKTNFTDNNSYKNGGGGLDVGFRIHCSEELNAGDVSFADNAISITECNFINNSATLYGGGTSVFSTRCMNTDQLKNRISFENCLWERNKASAGSALDLAPSVEHIFRTGISPMLYFADCRFISNSIRASVTNLSEAVSISTAGYGAVLITGLTVQFQGDTVFDNNNGSALLLSSGRVELLSGSVTSFRNNFGKNGGALSALSFSVILIHDNSSLKFVNNTATQLGGAIFIQSNDPHEYLSRGSCFIQYEGSTTQNQRHIMFIFEDNLALSGIGNDVYASSVRSCHCSGSSDNDSCIEELAMFTCIGKVNPTDNFDLATDIRTFEIGNISMLSEITPGDREYCIPIIAFDEHSKNRSVVYEVIQNETSHLKPTSSHISRNIVRFRGDNNATDIMKLELLTSTLSFDIHSMPMCPPGYSSSGKECICTAENYLGIAYCNKYGAYVIQGFWIGLCRNGEICTAHCPLGFCSNRNDSNRVHLLPNDVSQLEDFICKNTRKGILCGSCRNNNSAYYHSYMYSCGEEKLCKYGILFYILSEILPVTIMFFIIILFGISFTSGTVTGLILFAQVLDSVSIDANGVINFPSPLDTFTDIHRFIYRTLNFDFFSLEILSYCLWKDATVLDVMGMKYVTILYAICLVVILIISMNTWKCKKACSYWRPRTLQKAAVHGLTAFIVICYSQCARVSFQILTPSFLYSQNFTRVDTVVFRKGDDVIFSPRHLKYAVPALIIILIMSLLPFLLIFYPLIFKVLALCNQSESKLANMISRSLPIPLLDLFQSSFKDNCRFFAGFYFLYRLFALTAYVAASTLLIFYTIVELLLILFLALHSVVQPHKKYWHNVLDSLIFANLAIINGFTLYNYNRVTNNNDNKPSLTIVNILYVQAIFVYLPLLCICIYLSVKLFKKIKSRVTMDVPSDTSMINSLDDLEIREGLERCESAGGKRQMLLGEYTYGY